MPFFFLSKLQRSGARQLNFDALAKPNQIALLAEVTVDSILIGDGKHAVVDVGENVAHDLRSLPTEVADRIQTTSSSDHSDELIRSVGCFGPIAIGSNYVL